MSQSGVNRRSRIVDLIRDNGYISQAELARTLGVSEMTVRRDARLLSSEGLVRSVRGGILSIGESAPLVNYHLREQRGMALKLAIARAAAELVSSDTTIALDAGTTTLELARLLVPPLKLRVVTSSLPAINVLAGRPDIETIALGGTFNSELLLFTGPITLMALRQLHAHQVFLAATAIMRGTMYCNAMWESERKRALADIGDEVILLADSSKFGLTATTRVAPLTAVSTVIVDDLVAPAEVDAMQAAGIKVVLVPAGEHPEPSSTGVYAEQLS